MKVRTQIILILGISLILLAGLTIPGQARKNGHPESCSIRVLTVDPFGNFKLETKLEGELYAGWAGPQFTLFNQCTGVIPFGEPINPVNTFASYQDWCDNIPEASCVLGYFHWGPVSWNVWVYDPFSGNYYPAADNGLNIYPNGDFIFNSKYVP